MPKKKEPTKPKKKPPKKKPAKKKSPTSPPRFEYIDKPGTKEVIDFYKKFVLGKLTPQLKRLLSCEHKIVGIFGGNQSGKTYSPAYSYFMRVQGIHPLEDKNRLAKHIRCLCSSLPEGADEEAEHAAQYVELKRIFPSEQIEQDITARKRNLIVRSPTHGKSYFEFISTKQELQSTGGVQRDSLWCDEEPPSNYRDESRMRLLAQDGDEVISLTPTNGLSYLYDDVWLKASVIYRTPIISERFSLPEEEIHKDRDPEIACIQMATDDNPTLRPDTIDRIFEGVDDPDDVAIRRYGVFKQISGRIHKAYDTQTQFVDYDRYFPDGIPYEWFHSRGIDYHESRIPWSVGWISASPQDEWFLWQEFHPNTDGSHALNTYEIARHIARNSGDYYYKINLIDPLAQKKQPNTLMSVVDDLNRHFKQLRTEEGIGTRTYWQSWDTKDTKGRDEVRKRFKNASICGKPFNNKTRKHGRDKYLPTLWVCNTAPHFHKSIQRWSYDEFKTAQTKQINDPKPTPQPKFSHDPMTIECLAKSEHLRRAAERLRRTGGERDYGHRVHR